MELLGEVIQSGDTVSVSYRTCEIVDHEDVIQSIDGTDAESFVTDLSAMRRALPKPQALGPYSRFLLMKTVEQTRLFTCPQVWVRAWLRIAC